MKKKTNSPVVTEDYLNSRLEDFEGVIKGEFAIFRKDMREEVDGTITSAMSKLYTRIDPLLVELEDRRLDREIGTEQVQKLKGQVGNHETRIKKLETN